MSTSRYSKPDITSPSITDDYPEPGIKLDFSAIQPNTRKWTAVKLVTIAALLMIDLLALIGSTNLVESTALVILVIVNLWAINCTR
jgi:hypothetical protein